MVFTQKKESTRSSNWKALIAKVDWELKEGLHEALMNLGLSNYEAKAFVALTVLEESVAGNIAKLASVPLARIYDTLEGLEAKGLVHTTPIKGKPNKYRAIPYELAIEYLESTTSGRIGKSVQLATETLTKIKRLSKPPEIEPEPVRVIHGKTNINLTLKEMLQSVQAELVISLSVPYLQNISALVKQKLKEGVLVKGLCTDDREREMLEEIGAMSRQMDIEKDAPVLAEILSEQEQPSGIIVDNECSCIILPRPRGGPYAIVTCHPSIVSTLVFFFSTLFEKANR